MVYDQPDNSIRLVPLKVSIDLKPRQYRTRYVVPRLKSLIESEDVWRRCRDYAERIRKTNPLEHCCEVLEALGEGRSFQTVT
jgi:hypothetical protein